MKLAFVILAHDNPDKVARLARVLAQNHTVCVHYDLNSSEASFLALKRELGSLADRVLWPRRVRVAWGEWSIVNATLNALEAISGSDSNFDYVHLMSGADYPVRPIEEFTDYLRQNRGREFIECVDLRSEQWVKGGLVHERYRYRHFFNWKKHGFLFDQSWQLQQRLGLERGFPSGHQPHMGSQWWTLTWSTIKLVLAAGRNGELASFFKTVWIPDEMFIQTIVASATEPKARSPILTLYQFSDSGVPIVYGDDHAEYLNRQPFFFARKISPHAKNVRDLLDAYIDGSQRGAVFEERAVGTRTDEYTRYVDYWGMPNKHFRLIGHVADSWWGDLLYLHQPVFIICGVSRSELRSVANVVRNFPDIRVHGALFDRRRIEFVDDLTIYGGYRDDDIALRDDRRLTFLYDAIKEGEKVGAYTAFILPWHTDGEIGERMKWSRHSCTLVVRGSVISAYIEQELSEGVLLTETDAKPEAVELNGWSSFASFKQKYEDYFELLIANLRESRSSFIEIDLSSEFYESEVVGYVSSNLPRAVELAQNKRNIIEHSCEQLPEAFWLQMQAAKPVKELREYANLRFERFSKDPVIVVGASKAEVEFVAKVIARVADREFNSVCPKSAARVAEILGQAFDLGGARGIKGFFKVSGEIPKHLENLAFWADRTRVVIVHGNVFRGVTVFHESGSSAFERRCVKRLLGSNAKFLEVIANGRSEMHHPAARIDLLTEGWLAQLTDIFSGALGNRQVSVDLIYQWANEMGDPYAGMTPHDIELMSQLIEDADSRKAHLRIFHDTVRGSASENSQVNLGRQPATRRTGIY